MTISETEEMKLAFIDCCAVKLTKKNEEWWHTRFGYFVSGWYASNESREKRNKQPAPALSRKKLR